MVFLPESLAFDSKENLLMTGLGAAVPDTVAPNLDSFGAVFFSFSCSCLNLSMNEPSFTNRPEFVPFSIGGKPRPHRGNLKLQFASDGAVSLKLLDYMTFFTVQLEMVEGIFCLLGPKTQYRGSPEIPGNRGCITRSCAASAVGLHLVEPLEFQVDDTKLKRAGLDYWPYPSEFLRVFILLSNREKGYIENIVVHLSPLSNTRATPTITLAASASSIHLQIFDLELFVIRGSATLQFHAFGVVVMDYSYRRGDWLVFGSETSGVPPEALLDCKSEPFVGGTVRIPMVETYVRCLNLSVSVGIALYEASRQLDYEQLQSPSEPDNSEGAVLDLGAAPPSSEGISHGINDRSGQSQLLSYPLNVMLYTLSFGICICDHPARRENGEKIRGMWLWPPFRRS
ncbi:hypothetical protein RJ639_001387 [Escallonia herrerae]|uniref:tRNA/rRNA methyltransferase SpoU type domain-containing protein n=1 Tax=Escallonia herrerae TaxID=1293975 RepID=A0AA88XM66_9ASTE|nr:hypothetical protein RJ639_001387 [Escallonia herrerae]